MRECECPSLYFCVRAGAWVSGCECESLLLICESERESEGQIPNKGSAIPKIDHLSLIGASRTFRYPFSVYFLAMALGRRPIA